MFDWYKITKKYVLGESKFKPTIESRLQTLYELLTNFKVKTVNEQRRMQLALEQVLEIKKSHRKLLEEHKALQEQIKVLEESLKEKETVITEE